MLDHARPHLNEDDYRTRALLQFASEEAKHIHLFKKFAEEFKAGFVTNCETIGPPEEIGKAVLSHSPLGVALIILGIEWMTQKHYLDSVRDDKDLDPQFKSLLRHHWMEEAQHTKLGHTDGPSPDRQPQYHQDRKRHHRFLITAAHCVFENGEPVPLFVYGESKTHALIELRGAWEHQQGQPDLDIAVIGLSESCANDLQLRHWFSSPEDVSIVKPKTPGLHYLIVGYPASRNKRRPVQFGLPSRATALITGDICSVMTVQGVNKTEEDHFAIAFPHKKVDTPGGGVFHVPPPYGMSGGGVWRVV